MHRNLKILEIRIRTLVESDATSVREVAIESWNWAYRQIYAKNYIDSWIDNNYSVVSLVDSINRSNEENGMTFLGAFEGKELCGFLQGILRKDHGEILRLYVNPSKSRRGIGTQLLNEFEKYMLKERITTLIVGVQEKNDIGINFYAKHGFEKVSKESDEIIMSKRVCDAD